MRVAEGVRTDVADARFEGKVPEVFLYELVAQRLLFRTCTLRRTSTAQAQKNV